MKKIIGILLGSFLISSQLIAQSVGIGTTSPESSALLELKAINKGFLPPRMTAAQKMAIVAPKQGLVIYQTDGTKGLYIFDGTTWTTPGGTGVAAGGWGLAGNAGTNPAVNFIGTTDAQLLKFRQMNVSSGLLDAFDENVGLGANALDSNNGGGMNNAFGSQALTNNKIGYNNNAFGRKALFSNIDGSRNVAIGTSALAFNKSGNNNTAAGFNAAYSNVSGFSNVAIGTHSSYKNLSGYHTIAIGDSALFNNMGIENVAMGSKALFNNDDGVFNTGIGNQSLYSNINGSQNSAVGRGALFYNMSGNQNTAMGFQALYNNVYANRNTAMGYNSLFFNIAGADNTAVGHGSLAKNLSGGNTAVGSQALGLNTDGARVTGVGYRSLEKNTTGSMNTAVGAISLASNLDGYGNTAMGDFSLRNNENGVYNTALGAGALNANVSGNYNTALGYSANVHGDNFSNATAVGAFADVGCSNCVVLGSISGYNGAAVSSKVGIGTFSPQKTLHVNPNGAGGILIGDGLTTGGFTAMNMGISQASGGYSYIQSVKAAWPASTYGDLVLNQSGGNVGIRKATPSSPLHIKQSTDDPPYNGGLRLERYGNGNFWDISVDYANHLEFGFNGNTKVRFSNIDGDVYTVSDQRLKKDINPLPAALPLIMQLQAKSYHYKDNDDAAPLSYGFIAQELEHIFPDAVSTIGPGGMKAVGYQKLNIMAIKAIQEQQMIIRDQNKRISELEAKMEKVLNAIKQ